MHGFAGPLTAVVLEDKAATEAHLYTVRPMGEPRMWWPASITVSVYVPSMGMQYSTVYVPSPRSVTCRATKGARWYSRRDSYTKA